jgi:hypothetical protein
MLNEMKVYRPTRQNRFGTTVGSINYWKYCSITEPPVNRISGSAPAYICTYLLTYIYNLRKMVCFTCVPSVKHSWKTCHW